MGKKAKIVPYRFIAPNTEPGLTLYRWLLELLEAHHQDVVDARFALVWATGWKVDPDGHLILGQCRKSSDLEREIQDAAGYDFVILLNQHFWEDGLVSDTQRLALLDHELCHATVKTDDAGKPVIDERGRVTYRIRKHDLEEFAAIAERYGCWKRDIEAFGMALARARRGDRQWIGFSALHAQLQAAGAGVPLDAVVAWSEAERREALAWASTRAAGTLGPVCPPHVLAAAQEGEGKAS